MLAAKLDLLMKRLDERANEKEMQGTIKAMDSHMTCEVWEKSNILGTTAPRPMKMPHTLTTSSNNKIITAGIINLACKEVIRISTQISIQTNPH